MGKNEKYSGSAADGYIGYLAGKYPWFDAANRLLPEGTVQPVHIALADGFRPASSEGDLHNFFRGIVSADSERGDVALQDSDLITRFTERGDYRITVRDDTPEVSLETGFSDDADDMVFTEELASIYMSQECFGEAVKIYERLSLLYPEKSIYFAEIIGRAKILKAAKEEL